MAEEEKEDAAEAREKEKETRAEKKKAPAAKRDENAKKKEADKKHREDLLLDKQQRDKALADERAKASFRSIVAQGCCWCFPLHARCCQR